MNNNNELLYGQCVHGNNIASCTKCHQKPKQSRLRKKTELYGQCSVHGKNIALCEECQKNFDEITKAVKIEDLLALLSEHGGSIINADELEPMDIEQARATGRMFVDENLAAYVWEPGIDEFPTTKESVAFFLKWFPLNIPLPEKLKDPSFLFKRKDEDDNN